MIKMRFISIWVAVIAIEKTRQITIVTNFLNPAMNLLALSVCFDIDTDAGDFVLINPSAFVVSYPPGPTVPVLLT